MHEFHFWKQKKINNGLLIHFSYENTASLLLVTVACQQLTFEHRQQLS